MAGFLQTTRANQAEGARSASSVSGVWGQNEANLIWGCGRGSAQGLASSLLTDWRLLGESETYLAGSTSLDGQII